MTDVRRAEQKPLGPYDVVIVGAGISGALLAKSLALAGKTVLILEAGEEVKPNNNDYMKRFYESASKVPESPYTPELNEKSEKSGPVANFTSGESSDVRLRKPEAINAGRPTVLSLNERPLHAATGCSAPEGDHSYMDQSGSALAFGSTYERIAGGTARHWMGISLRHLPNDFNMRERYGTFTDRNGKPSIWPEWPKGCRYGDLLPWYDAAEREIGVSGDACVQKLFEQTFGFDGAPTHGYPMQEIPLSYSDKVLDRKLRQSPNLNVPIGDGKSVQLQVTPIPAARNSEPFNRRRACAGNSSCIPICPIQAKYDPTITLREAQNIGNLVTILYRTVVNDIRIKDPGLSGADNQVTQVDFIRYAQDKGGGTAPGSATAKIYVLAANAIETPRLMLMSNARKGITAADRPVGRYLMDHPFYIAAAKTIEPIYPYRGPLVTGGIEVMRDGPFRLEHASYRTDVSNSGWALTGSGSAQSIALDFITGSNASGFNQGKPAIAGRELVKSLNEILTRQACLGFLVEQTPDWENRVSLSEDKVDGLGLPRPRIEYDFSQYTKDGIASAAKLAADIFRELGWQPLPNPDSTDLCKFNNCSFNWKGKNFSYLGAGHIAGTCRMGEDPKTSVVDGQLRSWDHDNLYILGSSVFPTLGTANPTLTIAALSMRLGDHLARLLNKVA